MSEITVIIPNYNGAHFLAQCLPSLMRQSFRDFDILLVDNGSTDDSLLYIREHFPAVTIIPLAKNTGFSHAVNIGIRRSTSPYVLLLNTDTILHRDFLLHMYYAIRKSPSVFSVSSRMLCAESPSHIDGAGDWYTICGYAVCRGRMRKSFRYLHTARVFSSCAGAALYRRSVFDEIGLFDDRFFAYLEDVDIGYRARLHGYQNLYCPAASVLHAGSGTSGHGYTPFKVYYSARNNIFLLHKNQTTLQLLVNFPFILSGTLLKYLYFRKRNLGDAYLSGIRNGLHRMHSFPKVPHTKVQIHNAWKLELPLFKYTVLYLKDFLITHLLRF